MLRRYWDGRLVSALVGITSISVLVKLLQTNHIYNKVLLFNYLHIYVFQVLQRVDDINMHLQGCSISMSVCLLIVFFQVCDALLASSWLISPFLSSGVLSDLIISRPCGGCDMYKILFESYGVFAKINKSRKTAVFWPILG